MYTYEQRIMTVKLYQKYGCRVAPVIRKLGFPDRHMLVKWVTGLFQPDANNDKGLQQ